MVVELTVNASSQPRAPQGTAVREIRETSLPSSAVDRLLPPPLLQLLALVTLPNDIRSPVGQRMRQNQ